MSKITKLPINLKDILLGFVIGMATVLGVAIYDENRTTNQTSQVSEQPMRAVDPKAFHQ